MKIEVLEFLKGVYVLDQTYEEQFEPPTKIASDLKGKKVIFHMKTGLD